MKKSRTKPLKKFRAAFLFLVFGFAAGGFFYPHFTLRSSVAGAQAKNSSKTVVNVTEFPHGKHKMNCDSCHLFPSKNWETVRKTGAFPDVTEYPQHESCLNCHRRQFFRGTKPLICSICHTNPSPNDRSRHPFPNPREIFDLSPKGKTAVSDFQIFFPHDKHIEIVSRNETVSRSLFVTASFRRVDATSSCIVCHQTYQPQGDSDSEYVTKPPDKLGDAFWLKKGTFKTKPIGHTTCFTCHAADSGLTPAPSDCATCHKLAAPPGKSDFDAKTAAAMKIDDKLLLEAWRKRDSSAAFRHEFESHADQDCTACHNVTAIKTLDPLTKKVPLASCGICHATATTDDGGVLNYEAEERKKNAKFQCVKCHIAYGKLPIPESHFQAIKAAAQ